jgi:hypothetical protein
LAGRSTGASSERFGAVLPTRPAIRAADAADAPPNPPKRSQKDRLRFYDEHHNNAEQREEDHELKKNAFES